MGRILIGCAGFLGPRDKYWQHVDMVELQETFHSFPKPAALRRTRREAPEGACIVVTAHQIVTHPADDPSFRVSAEHKPSGPCGLLRETEAVESAWQSTLEAVEACDATGVLLRTPRAFTPSDGNRRALERFAERAQRELGPQRFLAWEPTGLWEADEAQALAEELGLRCAIDPLRDEPLEGASAYFRLRGLIGLRSRYSDDDLIDVLELASEFEETLLVFDHTERLRDARRAKALANDED